MGARMFFPLKHSGVFTVIPAAALSEREHRECGEGYEILFLSRKLPELFLRGD